MHAKNEYLDGNKLYVREIGRCSVFYKCGDGYRVWCRIFQRGERCYDYTRGDGFLLNVRKKLWLSKGARYVMASAIDGYDRLVGQAKDPAGGFTEVPFDAVKVTLRYRKTGGLFDCLYSTFPIQSVEPPREQYYAGLTLQEMLREFPRRSDISPRVDTDVYVWPDCDTLPTHPLYRAAVETGDDALRKELEIRYGDPSPEILAQLNRTDGIRRLPRLSEEFDRDHVVAINTIDFGILEASGYRLWHRPYFAMRGYTHKAYMLNPHTKNGVDAAPSGAEPIPFFEYLKLFPED